MIEKTPVERDEISERLFKIYTEPNAQLLKQVENLVSPNAYELAGYFYNSLLQISESKPYLNHKIVSERLHESLAQWLQDLFGPDDQAAVVNHIKRQRVIGQVHARINVPIKLVNHGIRLLKDKIGDILLESDLGDPQKFHALVLINNLLDYSTSLINESYIIHQLENENETKALRMNMISLSLVVELERLRASLFDWLRRTIVSIFEKYPEKRPALPSVYHSDYGLWAIYKAEFLFSEQPELTMKLQSQLRSTQEIVERINRLQGYETRDELSLAVEALNENVSHAAWLLGDFASRAYEMEAGRDPLTRLFNRRFLPPVMQNMIRTTQVSESMFSLLICDIDEFKTINDQHGHEIGDKAITIFGDFLVSQVRATDYIFRLGGDEFLIVLAGADAETSITVAKKLLNQLAIRQFNLTNGISTSLEMSIGIVEYDGHPDYLHMLNLADKALYKAKETGKNRFFAIQADGPD